MTYRISLPMLVSNVLTLDYSDQKRNESEKKYIRRIKENDEILQNALVKANELGWKSWLKSMRKSEESMIRYFTSVVNPKNSFTRLIVE